MRMKSSHLSARSYSMWSLWKVSSWSDLNIYVERMFFSHDGILGIGHIFLGSCLATTIFEKLSSLLVSTLEVCSDRTSCQSALLFSKKTGRCWEHWLRLGPILSSVTTTKYFSLDLAQGVGAGITISVLFTPTTSCRHLLLWHPSRWDWACSYLSPRALQMSRWKTRVHSNQWVIE